MRSSSGIAFLILCLMPLVSSFAQGICTDSRYAPGGFKLSSNDICHNETVTVTNTADVKDAVYYYNYRGESYEEVLASGSPALDLRAVEKPGLYQVIQVGKKDGKETVYCLPEKIKVRNSTTPVFSYTYCTHPTVLQISIPAHPLNDYSSYKITINDEVHTVAPGNSPYSFPVQNVTNNLTIAGQGGSKTCSSPPMTTVIPPFNPAGKDFDYYPEIKELKVLEDKSISLDFRGQYGQTYNLFRYPAGQPNVGLTPVRNNLDPAVDDRIADTPPNPDLVYCYFIQPAMADCGLFSLRSGDICSVPLTSPLPPTTTTAYLQWRSHAVGTVASDVVKISDTQTEIIPVNGLTTYQDDHLDCSKRNCYRIRVTYSGVVSGANFSGSSLSNQICTDHRVDLTDFPSGAYVTTQGTENRINFEGNGLSPYTLDRWELFKHDGTDYALAEVLPAGGPTAYITDPDAVTKSEKYKVRYVDQCGNASVFTPEFSSVFLSESGNNTLNWTAAVPFAEAGIDHYSIIYYEGDTPSGAPLGTQKAGAAIHSHAINTAAFNSTGTFVVKTISSDGRESSSNPVTFAVKGALFLPTAFSPNNDNTNDTFAAVGNLASIRTFRMEIFSSSGQKVAEVLDPTKGWDGRLPNGERALFGNYLYTLKAEMVNGQVISKNGSFVLLY